MTLDQLKLLQAIAEQGSVRAASAALHKTQPAISQGLKQLEIQLGLALVDRGGYRLSLTTQGERIYQQALRVLQEAEEVQRLAAHLQATNEAEITVAFDAAFDLNRLMPILQRAQIEFPHTRVHLCQESMSGALEAVIDQRADLAFSPMSEPMRELYDIESLPLSQHYLTTVAAPLLLARHPGLAKVEQLKDEYQIVVRDSGRLTEGQEFGVRSGQRKWFVNDFQTKRALIIEGLGWGKVPDEMVRNELADGQLVELTLTGGEMKVPVQYHAVRARHRSYGPVSQMLWQVAQALSIRRDS